MTKNILRAPLYARFFKKQKNRPFLKAGIFAMFFSEK